MVAPKLLDLNSVDENCGREVYVGGFLVSFVTKFHLPTEFQTICDGHNEQLCGVLQRKVLELHGTFRGRKFLLNRKNC